MFDTKNLSNPAPDPPGSEATSCETVQESVAHLGYRVDYQCSNLSVPHFSKQFLRNV
jgi:hypothetical protein